MLIREWVVELLFYSIWVNVVIVVECYMLLYDRWIKFFDNLEEKLVGIIKKIFLDNRMIIVEEIVDIVVFLLFNKFSYIIG